MTSNSQRFNDPIGWLKDAVRRLGFESVFGRYYGLYRAIVVDAEDPENRGRVRVMVPAIGHVSKEDVPSDLWALPVMPGAGDGHGVFCPPAEGDTAWVTFEGGRPALPLYVGGWWRVPTEVQPLMTGDVGIRSPGGSYLRIRERGGSNAILLARGANGAETGAMLSMDGSGSIILATDDGQHVFLDAATGSVTLRAADGSFLSAGNGEVSMVNAEGTKMFLSGANLEIQAAGNVVITASKIQLDGGAVDVGKGALEPAVKGMAMATKMAVHLHPTTSPGAPTGPDATGPMAAGSELSSSVRIA